MERQFKNSQWDASLALSDEPTSNGGIDQIRNCHYLPRNKETLIREIGVILTGGLGNQLFQIGTAAGFSQGVVLVYPQLGYPRMSDGVADSFLFIWPKSVLQAPSGSMWKMSRRLASYLLRKGIEPRKFERINIVNVSTDFLCQLGLQILLVRRLKIHVASDVGYGTPVSNDSNLLIGYFQSWRYVNHPRVMRLMMALEPRYENDRFRVLLNEVRVTKPVVLHIRLGDYLEEPHFGVPSENYYVSGLDELGVTGTDPIWIFTNDADFVTSKFARLLEGNAIVVEDIGLDPAQVMHLMRYASALIVANSTFSWWAAHLRFDRSAPVVAPTPWFKGMPEPNNLIPHDWVRLDAAWLD